LNEQEKARLANLQTPCVDIEFLKETHAINWLPDEQFDHDFNAWSATFRKDKPCGDGKAHRYAFEQFLQSQKLLTRAYASARLGMQPESLEELIQVLPRIGLSKRYAVYNGIIDESLSEDLVRSLRGLRFRTFGTHDSFCELLHGALRDTLGLTIRPLFCGTADDLGEQRMYASTWDSVTLRPLSTKHSVWLDFRKPLSLAPDRCSKLFFAANYDELRGYLAGREEPRDLRYYLEVVRGRK
jgi:hypothetical protein